jgi:phosphatidylinositol alpha-1,6-mannosyltransferase
VLIVANMHRRLLYKGHQQLIDGWQTIVNEFPEAELWIVGDGDGRHGLETRARELPAHVSKRIIFFGRLDQEALGRAYQTCRVFAMPSTGEGFGLVFVEAGRYGVPCIGGKHDGGQEIVLHGQTGLLVEQRPEDVAAACLRLLDDDDLALRLGHAGQQRYLDRFQFHHFRDRLLQAIGC